MKNNKMNWFKVCYENGGLEYAIKMSGEMFGAICEPTGNGKSGRAYEMLGLCQTGINNACKVVDVCRKYLQENKNLA